MWVSPSLYSEKLHANGQMVQQGERNILETFLLLAEHDNRIEIPRDGADLGGYLLGHNPFVQPGVEAYKKAMFALIGKPGHEDRAAKMEENLSKMERIRIHA